MLEADLPLAGITSFIGIVLVIVFFVTSSDSGSLVIDTITAGGKVDAPVPQRVFWCTFEGAGGDRAAAGRRAWGPCRPW
jgi:BCCT family betaine/carnitine transporter